jgi:hypothetical protein
MDTTDITLARLRAHRSNIARYRKLLASALVSDSERDFIERRLREETDSAEFSCHLRLRQTVAPFRKSAMSEVDRLVARGHEKVIAYYTWLRARRGMKLNA